MVNRAHEMKRPSAVVVVKAIVGSARWVVLAVTVAVWAPVVATAQPYDVRPTWGGDLWSRPRLTGDWFGFRDEMGQRDGSKRDPGQQQPRQGV